MKVVLTQEVTRLGAPGDVVDVADGYARNFLIPRKFAIAASRGALKQVDMIRRTREIREVRNVEQAQDIAKKLASLTIRVKAKAGDGGRLFGQVTPAQVADAVGKSGGPKIDRKRLQFEAPIKSLGAHTLRLRLHADVDAPFVIEVVKA